jgi:hypothetical protein
MLPDAGPDAHCGCAVEFWDTSMGELRETECHNSEEAFKRG